MPHDFTDELPLWSEPDAQAVLASICVKQGVDPDVLRELICIKRQFSSATGWSEHYRNQWRKWPWKNDASRGDIALFLW